MLKRVKRALGAFIGDKSFYKTAIAISIPIMVQMGITNLVNLLDNVMVGSLGDESMSGVAIINQFVFIFNLIVFGAVSAAGIFTAQFHGNRDVKGVRATFRFKLIVNVVAGILGACVFLIFSDVLINSFLHDAESGMDMALAFSEAKSYLNYIIIGLIPYAVSQVYASTLKETKNAVVPMIAGFSAVLVNLVLNAVLIYGLLGVPAMGVAGAAIATSISRFVELGILVVWTHTNSSKATFIKGAYRSLYIPKDLVRKITLKGMPILVNECLWSCAITFRNQCYSTKGPEALVATNISATVFNVFSVVYLSLGSAVAILVGNRLGAGDIEGAKDTSKKMIAFAVAVSVAMGLCTVGFAPLFPKMFNVSQESRAIATYMLIVQSCLMCIYACANSTYFTIRSGGKVITTMLLDSGFMWSVVVPISASLTYLTGINIYWLYIICQSSEIIKVIAGLILLKKSSWAKSLV